jgi:hypothetical protein
MSELRQFLESARQTHLAAHYPGDLAEEMQPAIARRRWTWPIVQAGVVAAAMAAVVLLAIRLAKMHVELESSPQTAEIESPDDLSFVPQFALELPQQPEEFSIVFDTPSFAFPSPPFPSINGLAGSARETL